MSPIDRWSIPPPQSVPNQDGPKADHALTFKMDQSREADHQAAVKLLKSVL
jgi:hypothetical protein